jgi:hypothetical protein
MRQIKKIKVVIAGPFAAGKTQFINLVRLKLLELRGEPNIWVKGRLKIIQLLQWILERFA